LDRIVLSLAVAVVAIALPDCINPSLIGGEVLFGAGSRPARQTAAFALAAFTVTFIVGLALGLGLGDLILSVLPKPGAKVKYALITAAGIVLVAGGAVLWIRRKALTSSGPEHHHEHKAPGSPILVGAGIAALEVLTAFPYFAAIALIVGSSASDSGKIFLLVLYCVVYAAPLFGIAVVCAVMGSRAESVLRPVIDWLLTRWPVFVAPLAAIIGIGLTAYGVVRLGSI
jgi:Sap, sulfolipid-1-addressing protein